MNCDLYSTVIAACVNLKLYKGNKSVFIIAFWEDAAKTVPLDLSVFAGTLKMQIRLRATDPRALVTLEEGTGLTIGATTNELTIESLGTLAANIYKYDCLGVNAGDTLTFLLGNYTIIQNVTR